MFALPLLRKRNIDIPADVLHIERRKPTRQPVIVKALLRQVHRLERRIEDLHSALPKIRDIKIRQRPLPKIRRRNRHSLEHGAIRLIHHNHCRRSDPRVPSRNRAIFGYKYKIRSLARSQQKRSRISVHHRPEGVPVAAPVEPAESSPPATPPLPPLYTASTAPAHFRTHHDSQPRVSPQGFTRFGSTLAKRRQIRNQIRLRVMLHSLRHRNLRRRTQHQRHHHRRTYTPRPANICSTIVLPPRRCSARSTSPG